MWLLSMNLYVGVWTFDKMYMFHGITESLACESLRRGAYLRTVEQLYASCFQTSVEIWFLVKESKWPKQSHFVSVRLSSSFVTNLSPGITTLLKFLNSVSLCLLFVLAATPFSN